MRLMFNDSGPHSSPVLCSPVLHPSLVPVHTDWFVKRLSLRITGITKDKNQILSISYCAVISAVTVSVLERALLEVLDLNWEIFQAWVISLLTLAASFDSVWHFIVVSCYNSLQQIRIIGTDGDS